MEPSLYASDLLLVTNAHSAPRRSRIVVIRTPDRPRTLWQVKRIVGLPGDSLLFEDGMLFINGVPHSEPYLQGLPAYLGLDRMSFEISGNRYFVLGDNRAHSEDSRDYGAITSNRIVGIVRGRLWPLLRRRSRIGNHSTR